MNQKKMEADLKKRRRKKDGRRPQKNKKNEDDINNKNLLSIPLKFRPNLSLRFWSPLSQGLPPLQCQCQDMC